VSERDDDAGGDVLSGLPAKRPQRRSARRDGAKPKAEGKAKAAPRAKAASTARSAKTAKLPGAKRSATAGGTRRATPRKPEETGPRPRAVHPSAATQASTSRPAERPADPPEGLALVGTAVRAAGELAQLGLTLGARALRAAAGRLPRP
jgi:hypothetical protein